MFAQDLEKLIGIYVTVLSKNAGMGDMIIGKLERIEETGMFRCQGESEGIKVDHISFAAADVEEIWDRTINLKDNMPKSENYNLPTHCPKCNADFQGEEIPEESRRQRG